MVVVIIAELKVWVALVHQGARPRKSPAIRESHNFPIYLIVIFSPASRSDLDSLAVLSVSSFILRCSCRQRNEAPREVIDGCSGGSNFFCRIFPKIRTATEFTNLDTV